MEQVVDATSHCATTGAEGPDSARNRGGSAVAVHDKVIKILSAAQRQIPVVEMM